MSGAELSVLAAIYERALERQIKKEAAPRQGRPEDAKGRSKHDSRAGTSIQE
jgi:hypothetical protein